MERHLWLIGMMGSGKSSVGRLLAASLGGSFVDSDDVVAGRMGCSIAEFWRRHGEEAFRDIESTAINRLASQRARVIATGGGVVLREPNVSAMRSSGFVVWLQASVGTLRRRVNDNDRRPLLVGEDTGDRLQALLDERKDRYAAAAHATVATDGLELETVVERIEELWNAF